MDRVRLVLATGTYSGQWPPAALVLRIVPNEVLPGPRTYGRFHAEAGPLTHILRR